MKSLLSAVVALVLLAASALPALPQAQFPDASNTAINHSSVVPLCLDSNGRASVMCAAHSTSTSRATADKLVKSGAGFIHTVSIAGLTATPTAGLLTIYDNTAESGTVIYAEWVFATVVGHTVTLDSPVSTGIYVGFDGSLANAQVTVSYR